MSNLIIKYRISENDLYSIGLVEIQKKDASYLQKEKLKVVILKILKPYNVKFMDLGGLLSEIKNGAFDIKYSESISSEDKLEIQKMINENSNISKFYTEWWSGKSKKQKWIIAISIVFVFGLIGQLSEPKNNYSSNTNSSSSNNSRSLEGSKKAYRAGYADGQLQYGESAPPSYEYFLANHPEINGADKMVYRMGYIDGAKGKAKQY